MRLPSSVALLAASLAQVQAEFLLNDLSFGYGTRINPDGRQAIPNFSLQGTPNVPEILSTKIILTAPAPGNQRGAVWGDKPLSQTNWIADIDFRANGPERASGNLNIWLARDGPHAIGSGSIYTVGKFEGLALVVDQHGGSGGMLRGFLNDGSKDFSKSHSVDSLAFGNCNFPYRNLGRPSQVKLRHSATSFKVEVDGKPCFESDKISIPAGYQFGITAASADNPDSFEVFKLVVLDDKPSAGQGQQDAQKPLGDADKTSGRWDSNAGFFGGQQGGSGSGSVSAKQFEKDDIPDAPAEKYTSSQSQFQDLHMRIQSVNHHVSTIFRTIAQQGSVGEKRHEELSVMLGELKGLMTKLDKVEALNQKLDDMQREMVRMRAEMDRSVRDSANSIKYHVSDKHETLSEHVAQHAAPGHTKLILVIVGGQLLLVTSYILYMRRRESMPKKYL